MRYHKNKKILISIIVPYYNSYIHIMSHLKRAKHVATDLPVEFIYIDDGSIEQKAYHYLKKEIENITNIRVYKLKNNLGPGIARNLGIKKSLSSNIIFLDSDDELIKKELKKLIDYLIMNNEYYDIIFYNFIRKKYKQINLSKKIFNHGQLVKNYLRLELDMCPNFYLYNKNFLINNSIYFQKGIYEDINFCLKCFVHIKKIKRINLTLYKKNVVKNSITSSYSDRHLVDFIKSSLSKFKYFNNVIKNKFKCVKSSDLQYGLRGDYVAARKIFNNIKNSEYSVNYINHKYKKIINKKFAPITEYDKFTKNNLFPRL